MSYLVIIIERLDHQDRNITCVLLEKIDMLVNRIS